MKNSQALSASMDVLTMIQSEFLNALPGISLGLSVLVIGIAAAYLLRWVFSGLLLKAVEWLPSRISSSAFMESYFKPMATALGKIVFFTILLVALATSLNKMGLGIASGWLSGLVQYLPNAVAAVVIMFLGWRLKELLEDVLQTALVKSKISYAGVLSKSIAWTVFALSALMALSQIGIDLNILIVLITALLGAMVLSLSLMLALGAKDVLSNVFHCHQLRKIFREGDLVQFGKIEGTISALGPSYVIFETANGKVALAGKSFNTSEPIVVKKDVSK